MKKPLLILALVVPALIGGLIAVAQEPCDELPDFVKKYLDPKSGDKGVFISDGQVYQAFLDDEQKAEFHVTFYGGSTYRIAASAGSQDKSVIFEVLDEERNLLFSNAEYSNEPYWDFNVASTVDCIIETRLDLDKKTSGCAVMLIGFKQ
jgi:hypothetical protein